MSEALDINSISLKKIGLYCFTSLILYLTATGLILFIKNNRTIDDVAIILKTLSFSAVIWANGEVILKDKKDKHARRLNSAIILLMIIIMFGLFIKYFELDFNNLPNIQADVANAVSIFIEYITWISILPMLFYGLLDYYIMRRSSSSPDTKDRAKAFFVFNDVVCLLPLIAISSAGLMALSIGFFSKAELETMVSGSLAATLFASAFATKTIELCYDQHA